jgi:hypothetical protein
MSEDNNEQEDLASEVPSPLEETEELISQLSTAEQAEARLEICKGCPSLRLNVICRTCQCFVVGKVWFNNQSCPEDKW